VRPALLVDNLCVDRDQRPILERVSFQVAPGALCAVVGPNGAGKSTLLRAILGLQRFRGQVQGPGTRMGYVPQALTRAELFPLTALELVRAGGGGAWWPRLQQQQALLALERVGMAHRAAVRVDRLSGGEFQRVLLAHALVGRAELLLLDEPTTGLDAQAVAELFQQLATLREVEGVAILMVCHELDWVVRHADWVVCLNRRVMAQGRPRATLAEQMAYGR